MTEPMTGAIDLSQFAPNRPLALEIAHGSHVQLDVVLLTSGGIVLCVDKIPHAFASSVQELKKSVEQVIDHVLTEVKRKEVAAATQQNGNQG